MKHWLRMHTLALASTLRLLLQSPVASMLNLLVVGIVVALPLGLYTLVGNLQRLAGQLPAAPQASVYLTPSANAADLQRVRALAQADKGVAKVRHIDKDEALRELEQSSGMSELLAGLGGNPLPDTLVLDLTNAESALLDTLVTRLKADPAVDQVQLDSEWAQRLAALVKLGQEATTTVATLFGIGLLLVTANLIRMQILTRREEIEVSKLIGATDSFIRRPFIYFAALQGLLGGLVGIAVVALVQARLNHPVAQLAKLYGQRYSLDLPPAWAMLATLLLVVGLSLAGAIVSVRRHLRALDA